MDNRVKAVVALTIGCIIGFFIYISGAEEKDQTRKALKFAIMEKETLKKNMDILEERVNSLQRRIDLEKEQVVPKEKLKQAFGEKPKPQRTARQKPTCDEIDAKIITFFKYLDNKKYIQERNLKNGIEGKFMSTLQKLSEKPPIVTGEMNDLFALVSNVAHFCRVLGSEDIILIKDVMKNDADLVESAMGAIFDWMTAEHICGKAFEGTPGLEVMYGYSGFFLNSLGGRSYLLRRDSRVRMLTIYYSILVLDLANDQGLNQDGLDIRSHIDFCLYDLLSQKGLLHKNIYIKRLGKLKEKYSSLN